MRGKRIMTYIIKDWADNEMSGFGQFKSFDDASIALDTHCHGIIKQDYPMLDDMSDSFGDLVDKERGEYVIVEVK